MRYPTMPAAAFIAAFLVLIPLPALWRLQSVALISMLVWLFVTNLIFAVHALVWADNDVVQIPVWCDISEYESRVEKRGGR